MSKPIEKPDKAASERTIEEQYRVAAPMEAASVPGRHHDIKPKNSIAFHQALDTEHRPQSPRNLGSHSLEESEKGLKGQHEAPPVTEAFLTPLVGMYGSASQRQLRDSFHNSATSLLAPYTFNDAPHVDRTEAPYSWPRVVLNKALDTTRSTTLGDVGSSSQLDQDAHTTGAEDPNVRGWQPSFHDGQAYGLVLPEPQAENFSFPATFDESFTCSTCKRKLRNKSAYRKHLETHDPSRSKRYACKHDGCDKGFRYPKDLRRHTREHLGPSAREFACSQPGCTASFDRRDNLARHCRYKHPEPDTNASARLLPSNFWTPTSPVDTSLGSFDGVIDPRLILPPSMFRDDANGRQLDGFDGYLDPRFISPTSMSHDYHLGATESVQSTTPASMYAAEPGPGHDDISPRSWEKIVSEASNSRPLDELSPLQDLKEATWVPGFAKETAGDTMDSSHTSQSLPLRDATAPSTDYYNSSESGSSSFEQSKITKDMLSFDTASSPADLPGHIDTNFKLFGEHHQQTSRNSRGESHPNEIDDDQSSCAESVFSQESTASTATSLGGSLGTTGLLEMVNRTVSALFAGDLAFSINSAAVEDPGIGRERYRRNIRRMIKIFGKSLKAEASTVTERRIAAAMQTRWISTQVAQEITTKANATRPSSRRPAQCSEWTQEEQHSDTSTDSADEDEAIMTQEPEDEAKTRKFILDSDACLQFKRTLFEFVHRPYERRIMNALNSSRNGTARYDRNHLARVAREISWVSTDLLCFSHDQSLAVSDHFKGYVEDFMGETWNWSPFTARRYPLQVDFCRLSWKSPNGETRYIDLPKDVEGAVRDAFDTAPQFLNHVDSTPTTGTVAAGATSNSTPTIPLPSHQAGAGKASSLSSGPQIPLQSPGAPVPSITCGLQLCAQTPQIQQNGHHVYLCVEAGSREFVGLSCAGIQTDIQFFNRIKSEYNAARGWFRLWFSTWRYDHCEFMQFQMTGIRLGARLQIAFPAPTDLLYDYMPKPLKEMELPPHGPISPDEFRQHYYYQVCPSLLSWERWHARRTGLSLAETKAFDAAPKRVVELDMQNGRRELFYGLYAKEARSAMRVAIHMSICCFPGVIFFFLWLYQWGHGADLQGAAVPVQLSLTLVAGYLGVLYWTR